MKDAIEVAMLLPKKRAARMGAMLLDAARLPGRVEVSIVERGKDNGSVVVFGPFVGLSRYKVADVSEDSTVLPFVHVVALTEFRGLVLDVEVYSIKKNVCWEIADDTLSHLINLVAPLINTMGNSWGLPPVEEAPPRKIFEVARRISVRNGEIVEEILIEPEKDDTQEDFDDEEALADTAETASEDRPETDREPVAV